MDYPKSLFKLLILLACLALPGIARESPSVDYAALVGQFTGESDKEYRDAELALWKTGRAALPQLARIADSEDPEIFDRANKLILRIKACLPPGEVSPETELIDRYFSANEENRKLLLNSFSPVPEKGFRRLLTEAILESRENGSATLFYPALSTALQSETEKLLDEGRIKAALDLWANVEISPGIRHRYVALLYYSGLPWDKSVYTENEVKLIEAELALLALDFNKARQLAPDEPYVANRLGAVNFDLAERWRSMLGDGNDINTYPTPILPAAWSLAKYKGNEETATRITNRLKDEYDIAINNSENEGMSSLALAKLLLVTNQTDFVLTATAKACFGPSVEAEYPPGNLNFQLAVSPCFNITLAGAKEDSLEAVLALAGSISPLKMKLWGKADYEEEDARKVQRLVFLGLYLHARGEGSKIIPYIDAHLSSLRGESWRKATTIYIWLLGYYNAPELAFDLYRNHFRSLGDIREIMEYLLYEPMGRMDDEAKRKWNTILSHVDDLSGKKLPHEEKVYQALLLTGKIPDHKDERTILFSNSLKHLEKDNSDESLEMASILLSDLFLNPDIPFSETIKLLETLKKPVLPKYQDIFLGVPLLVNYYFPLLPEDIIASYEQLFEAFLESSKTIYPQKLNPAGPPSAGYFPKEITKAFAGEFLAAILQNKGEFQKAKTLRSKSRLYACKEGLFRGMNALLMSSEIITPELVLESVSPSFCVEESESDELRNDQFYSSFNAAPLCHYLLIMKDYHKAHYLSEAALYDLFSYGGQEYITDKFILFLRGQAELIRALAEWEKGNRESSLKAFHSAYKMQRQLGCTSSFYWLCLKNEPSLRPILEKLYQEERTFALDYLKKWPNHDAMRQSILFSSLALGKFDGEMESILKEAKSPFIQSSVGDLKDILGKTGTLKREDIYKLLQQYLMKYGAGIDMASYMLSYYSLNID